jgi:hypothetical protein
MKLFKLFLLNQKGFMFNPFTKKFDVLVAIKMLELKLFGIGT